MSDLGAEPQVAAATPQRLLLAAKKSLRSRDNHIRRNRELITALKKRVEDLSWQLMDKNTRISQQKQQLEHAQLESYDNKKRCQEHNERCQLLEAELTNALRTIGCYEVEADAALDVWEDGVENHLEGADSHAPSHTEGVEVAPPHNRAPVGQNTPGHEQTLANSHAGAAADTAAQRAAAIGLAAAQLTTSAAVVAEQRVADADSRTVDLGKKIVARLAVANCHEDLRELSAQVSVDITAAKNRVAMSEQLARQAIIAEEAATRAAAASRTTAVTHALQKESAEAKEEREMIVGLNIIRLFNDRATATKKGRYQGGRHKKNGMQQIEDSAKTILDKAKVLDNPVARALGLGDCRIAATTGIDQGGRPIVNMSGFLLDDDSRKRFRALAYHIVWCAYFKRPPPGIPGQFFSHLCHHSRCCNPLHAIWETLKENKDRDQCRAHQGARCQHKIKCCPYPGAL